jgi:hypothetical protein
MDLTTKTAITHVETVIDTKRQSFDMQKIANRRFMFNPKTGTLILGKQYKSGKLISSHAVEHGRAETGEPFDDFIRGWVGTGGQFDNGIIHIAPPIPKDHALMFGKGFSTLEMFARNGANGDTVIRGFPYAWKQPLSNLINFEKFIGKERELMDENNIPQVNLSASSPLTENEYVQQLFSILQDNGRDTTGLSALIGHVSEMENFVTRAEQKIADMKSQLAEMKEVQNHPVKTALTNAIKSLENKVAQVKEHLSELKQNIAEGCKTAVQAFKEKGAAALNNLAKFFHIKGGLKALDKSAEQSVKLCDKSVARINEFANQYHTAGRAIANLGRMLLGQDPINAKKEAGILAKSLAAPYKAKRALMIQISKSTNAMVVTLKQLETTVADKREQRVREKEPTLLDEVRDAQSLVARRKLELPAPERFKVKGAAEI